MTKEGDVDDRPKLQCENCQTIFQGFGCDSTSKTLDNGDISLTCGFGSKHDLTKFTFAPETFPQGEICDNCTKEAVLEGKAVDIDSYADSSYDGLSLLEKIKKTYPKLSQHQLLKIEQNRIQRTKNATSSKLHGFGFGRLFNRGPQNPDS